MNSVRLELVCRDDEMVLHYPGEVPGEFPTTILVRVIETAQYDREWAATCGKYNVEVMAVSPEAAGPSGCLEAAEFMGYSEEHFEMVPEPYRSLILAQYGIKAVLWDATSDDRRRLLIGARAAIRRAVQDFDRALDRPMNAMGSTGHQFIRGKV